MHSKTALIVDDEATIRLYIKTVLQQLGFETLEVKRLTGCKPFSFCETTR